MITGRPENSPTPNLAALAAAGVRFENAYTVIPITAPSHAAMFYSLPPHVFKIYNNGQKRAVPYPTLAEIMKKKGYATGAVISLAVLNRDFGLAKGFDHYLENFRPGLWYRTAAEVNRDAFALIDKLKNGKSFIWLHYSDPHEPYFPARATSARFTVTLGDDVLYSGPSIEQPVLRLPLTAAAGRDRHRPGNGAARPRSAPDGAFAGIGYSDLQRQGPGRGQRDIAMAPSPDLSRRSERYGLVTFNTQSTRSSLTVTNRGNAPCRAELAFKYQVKTSPEARRSGYEQEVRYLDSQIGLLLDHLKKRGFTKNRLFWSWAITARGWANTARISATSIT